MEFWTTLIVTAKEQTVEASNAIKDNCVYVSNHCWLSEGDSGYLEDKGVVFNELGEGAVPSLGGLLKHELIKICQDVFGVNVYEQAYTEKKQ